MPPKPIVYFPVAKHSIHNSPSPFIKNKFEERRARRLIVADRAVEAKRSRICLAVGSHLPKALSCLRPSPIQRAAARKQSPRHGPPPTAWRRRSMRLRPAPIAALAPGGSLLPNPRGRRCRAGAGTLDDGRRYAAFPFTVSTTGRLLFFSCFMKSLERRRKVVSDWMSLVSSWVFRRACLRLAGWQYSQGR